MSGRSSRSNSRAEGSRRHRSRSCKDRDRPHRSSHRRRRDASRKGRDSPRNQALDTILLRLNAIETRLSTSECISEPSRPARECHTPPLPVAKDKITSSVEPICETTNKIVNALNSLIQAKPSHYYISNFDPNVHDFDVWCAEVDRGCELNRWDDRECLSRIGGCLKGDARTWLNDWVSHDRTWSNFKLEFRSLCPRSVDVANILYDVMSTNSDSFASYADYARKSLLRLNIVRGLSDDLKTAIIIRGITDPQVKATASNAKLLHSELVEFLSVYTKPKNDFQNTRINNRGLNVGQSDPRKHKSAKSNIKCYNCGDIGHAKSHCSKRKKTEPKKFVTAHVASNKAPLSCTYCNKVGHTVDKCFTKQRVDSKGQDSTSVNFCQTTPDAAMQ